MISVHARDTDMFRGVGRGGGGGRGGRTTPLFGGNFHTFLI